MIDERKVSFESLVLGASEPTSVDEETIHTIISADNLLGDYGKAFIAEARRVNPLKAEVIGLTEEEVRAYCIYLLEKRIECVNNDCKDYRKLKVLYIPSWIQYSLSMVGEVIIREKGLKLIPEMEEGIDVIDFDAAKEISDKIGAFEEDLQILQDAMPRSPKGDRDVMTTALIAGYMRSIEKVNHVAATYVAAFLGFKIKEELAMKVLYRIQYDDIQFIASALLHERGIFH